MLRLASGELDAQVIVQGRRHSVRVSARGRVVDVPTPGGPASRRCASMRARRHGSSETVTRQTGRQRASVSYLVLMRLGGRPQWQLFFKDGTHFSASASGRNVRRAGG